MEAITKVTVGHALLGKEPQRIGRHAVETPQILLHLLHRGRHQKRGAIAVLELLAEVAYRIHHLGEVTEVHAEDHLVGLDHLMRDAVVLAVALSPGHRLAAEGRVVQGDGPKADPAGPAQVHAVAGLQPAGEGDKQFAISCQGADEPLFPGLKVLIVSPIQRDYIGIHNNAPDGE